MNNALAIRAVGREIDTRDTRKFDQSHIDEQ